MSFVPQQKEGKGKNTFSISSYVFVAVNNREEREITHVIKFVSPFYCAPLWILTSPQHTFLLVVKLLFQMFALAASAQADKKGLRGKCNINQNQNTKRHQSSATAPNYCISVSNCLCFHIWGGNKRQVRLKQMRCAINQSSTLTNVEKQSRETTAAISVHFLALLGSYSHFPSSIWLMAQSLWWPINKVKWGLEWLRLCRISSG